MENQLEIICPSCKSSISPASLFCPNCGEQLKNKPAETRLSKQIIAYLVSIFIPPFGLWYTYKYFKAGDAKSRKVAIVTIILTIMSILSTLWFTQMFVDSISQGII